MARSGSKTRAVVAPVTLCGEVVASNEVDFDLVIIGGGTTGLTVARLAERLGLSICLLEGETALRRKGLTDALNARTLQMLEAAGFLDDILASGFSSNASSIFSKGRLASRQSEWWTGLAYCHRRHFHVIGQPAIERALAGRIGARIRYGEKATSILETTEHVSVRTDQGGVVRGRYVVGADGADSTVRTSLGIDFTGTLPSSTWTVVDAHIDTTFPVRREMVILRRESEGESRVAWIPRDKGLATFYLLIDGEVTRERVEIMIREHVAPHTIVFKDTPLLGTFKVRERTAERFISRRGRGRVILAGDAAHTHMLNGGHGLNTGIADAFALVWRLGRIFDNGSARAQDTGRLLMSYENERRAIALELNGIALRLSKGAVPRTRGYATAMRKAAGHITGMGVSYELVGSVCVRTSRHGIWVAGRRCPDVPLSPASGSGSKRLYELASDGYGMPLVLRVGKRDRSGWSGERRSGLARFILVTNAPSDCPTGGVLRDSLSLVGEYFANWVGSGDQFTVVIRPDMYVAYVSSSDDWAQYLAEWTH